MEVVSKILLYGMPILLILLILIGLKLTKNATRGTADPIAEADVYLAYGRKAQAIEILKEALIADPSRHDIKSKLEALEV